MVFHLVIMMDYDENPNPFEPISAELGPFHVVHGNRGIPGKHEWRQEIGIGTELRFGSHRDVFFRDRCNDWCDWIGRRCLSFHVVAIMR